MTPGRIASALVLAWSACCLALAALIFFNLPHVELPERYVPLAFGCLMLYMGGSALTAVIWPPKPKDPNAPIDVPPRGQVRGRTSYRDDSTWTRNVMLAIGTIFLIVSIAAAAAQPALLLLGLIAIGILAGAGVKTWRQHRYGSARLELDMPARRGDVLQGVITTSGSAWRAVDKEDMEATVEVTAIRSSRGGGRSHSADIAQSRAAGSVMRNGEKVTIRFRTTVPLIDTSEGRFTWNVQLTMPFVQYRATFVIDVA
ncbi:MAG: hypothetical protein M3Q69_04610 [Acidobacteriota bacterium]|nr:hypothetical protein [Acidobacteriota bacterium]